MAEIPKYTIIMTVIFINAQELHIFEHSKKKKHTKLEFICD